MITWDMVTEQRVPKGILWTVGTQWFILPVLWVKQYNADPALRKRKQDVALSFFNRKENK